MARTISAALLAAQRATARRPYVTAVLENSVGGARRFDFVRTATNVTNIAPHGAAVADPIGGRQRVRMASAGGGGDLLHSRGTGAYSTLVADANCGTYCNVAATGTTSRVAVVYTDAAGTGVKIRESTNGGVSFGSEAAVFTAGAAIEGIAVAYKNSSGDLAIAVTYGTTVEIIKRVSGSFGSADAEDFSADVASWSANNNIAMEYAFDYEIVLTGVAVSTKPTIWTTIYGDGNNVANNTWDALNAQLEANAEADVTFVAPSLLFSDTYRMTFCELDAFPGGSNRTWLARLHPATAYNAGPFTWHVFAPVADYAEDHGLAISATPTGSGKVYLTGPGDAVYEADQAQVQTDVTDDVLAISIDEQAFSGGGYLDLDNHDGAYKAGAAGYPGALQLGNLCAISWGYYTSSGDQASRMADLWITDIEHRQSGGRATVRVHVANAWHLLARHHDRTDTVHDGSDDYADILARIFSRAGISLSNSGASTRATTVTPTLHLPCDIDARAVALRVLDYLADRVIMGTLATAILTEPLTTDNIDLSMTGHPLGEIRVASSTPRVAAVHALGAGAFGEAYQAAPVSDQHLAPRTTIRDFSSDDGAEADATATAHLRRHFLDTPAGELELQPHVGAEVCDVLQFSASTISSLPLTKRVRAVHWRYNRERGIFRQTLDLGER